MSFPILTRQFGLKGEVAALTNEGSVATFVQLFFFDAAGLITNVGRARTFERRFHVTEENNNRPTKRRRLL